MIKNAKAHFDSGVVARELDVESVLDGTFHKVGDVIRVSVQLVGAQQRATLVGRTARCCSVASRPMIASAMPMPHAVAWFRHAVELGNHNYPWFSRDRNYDSVRGDVEYEAPLAVARAAWTRYRQQFA